MKRTIKTILYLSIIAIIIPSCKKNSTDNDSEFFVSKGIGPIVDTIVLPGFATVKFPSGSLASLVNVKLGKTNRAQSIEDFESTQQLFGVVYKANYEIRIIVGAYQPKSSVEVTLNIPKELSDKISVDNGIQVAGQLYTSNDIEALDN